MANVIPVALREGDRRNTVNAGEREAGEQHITRAGLRVADFP